MFNRFIFLFLFSLRLCFLEAHDDSFLHDLSEELDLSSIDLSEFDADPFWNRAFVESAIINSEDLHQTAASTEQPEWSSENDDHVHSYYASHQEGRIDRMLGFLACKLGVLVHGDIQQEQLALQLQAFDCRKLMQNGPIPPPFYL